MAIKLHTTRYNTIQHDTKGGKTSEFVQNQSCMMLYEMLYSFGQALDNCIIAVWNAKGIVGL